MLFVLPCRYHAGKVRFMMKLKQYLKQKTVRRDEFAKKIGTSPAYICHVIAGRRNPSLDMMIRIHDATGGLVDLNSWHPDLKGGAK